jgi:uncharacterized protein (TIGR02284 family)
MNATSKTQPARARGPKATVDGSIDGAKARMMLDHEQLARRLLQLTDYVNANDLPLAREEWDDLEDALLRHMDAEEMFLLPAFARENPQEGSILLGEHKVIKQLVGDIGLALDLHTLRAGTVEELRTLLARHAQRESRDLYVWADQERNRAQATQALRRLAVQPMSASRVISILTGLVETCGDGQRGYQRAAAQTRDEGYRLVFTRYAEERARFVRTLGQLVERREPGAQLGDGTVLGGLHRGWLEASSTLSHGRPGYLLRECVRGEDAALKNFRAAMHAGLPVDAQEVVQTQYDGIKRAREELGTLLAMEKVPGEDAKG